MNPPRLPVTLIDRGERVSPRFIVRRPMTDDHDPDWRDEPVDDPAIAEWAAETAARITGRPLVRIVCGRPSS